MTNQTSTAHKSEDILRGVAEVLKCGWRDVPNTITKIQSEIAAKRGEIARLNAAMEAKDFGITCYTAP